MKKFPKLQKLLKNKTLTNLHIDESRDSDAIIASLLDWKHIEVDSNKEWVGDISGSKIFGCIGKCVVPKFTTTDYNIILSLINKVVAPSDSVTLTIHNNFVAGVMTINGNVETVEAPTIPLAVCRLFIEIINSGNKKKKRGRKKKVV